MSGPTALLPRSLAGVITGAHCPQKRKPTPSCSSSVPARSLSRITTCGTGARSIAASGRGGWSSSSSSAAPNRLLPAGMTIRSTIPIRMPGRVRPFLPVAVRAVICGTGCVLVETTTVTRPGPTLARFGISPPRNPSRRPQLKRPTSSRGTDPVLLRARVGRRPATGFAGGGRGVLRRLRLAAASWPRESR